MSFFFYCKIVVAVAWLETSHIWPKISDVIACQRVNHCAVFILMRCQAINHSKDGYVTPEASMMITLELPENDFHHDRHLRPTIN